MAAARWLHSRLIQPLARRHLQNNSPFREGSYQSLPLSNTIFGRYINLRRGIQTQAEASISCENQVSEQAEANTTQPETVPYSKTDAQNSAKANAMSNLKLSTRHDLAAVFTCKVCETRSMKTFSRDSYEKGVVVVRCGGCNNLHLLADRLGWFGEPGSIEDLLAARGEEFKKGSADSINLTLEDFAGKNPLNSTTS